MVIKDIVRPFSRPGNGQDNFVAALVSRNKYCSMSSRKKLFKRVQLSVIAARSYLLHVSIADTCVSDSCLFSLIASLTAIFDNATCILDNRPPVRRFCPQLTVIVKLCICAYTFPLPFVGAVAAVQPVQLARFTRNFSVCK